MICLENVYTVDDMAVEFSVATGDCHDLDPDSPDFAHNGPMPARLTCDGRDLAPTPLVGFADRNPKSGADRGRSRRPRPGGAPYDLGSLGAV